MKNSDVTIDFSQAGAVEEICRAALQHRQSLVIGTTGHSPERRHTIEETAKSLPIVFASNFSIGVNVLFALTHRAGEILGPEFAPEISATQSIREGDVVGDHTVVFTGPGERLELTHRASSREIFARGALRAAEWIMGKSPGLYSMQEVLGLSPDK
jgi:4-hydroxy-tetrahydrodipicolinate reductase